MKTGKSAFIAALIFSLAIVSCKKETVNKVTSLSPGVYAAGDININNWAYAAYWANGVEKQLEFIRTSVALGIAISSNDVYVVGWRVAATGYNAAALWKNGVRSNLVPDTTMNSQANAVIANAGDIFVAGTINGFTLHETAVFWKNGVMTQLPDIGAGACAQAITMYNNDLYIAGFIHNGDGIKAAYWKNGTLILPEPGDNLSQVYGITVNDAGVHLAGEVNADGFEPFVQNSTAAYWKNSSLTQLPAPAGHTVGYSVAASGNDVYVTGYFTSATSFASGYWRNGIFVPLATGNDSGYSMAAVIQGADLYIGGNLAHGYNPAYPVYWKNGTPVVLSSNAGGVAALTVLAK